MYFNENDSLDVLAYRDTRQVDPKTKERGRRVEIYVTPATTKTQKAYESDKWTTVRNKTTDTRAEAQLKHGAKAIKGFETGALGLPADKFLKYSENDCLTAHIRACIAKAEQFYKLRREMALVNDISPGDNYDYPNRYEPWYPYAKDEIPASIREEHFKPHNLDGFPYSSDPESMWFVPNWHKVFVNGNPGIVKFVALELFEAAALQAEPEETENP